MFYLIDHDEISAESFVTKVFDGLQPHPENSTTQRWTDYIIHPNTGICLICIPNNYKIPLKPNPDISIFNTYLDNFINDGILEESIKEQVGSLLLDEEGNQLSRLNVSQLIKDIFNGTDRIIYYRAAVNGGWISEGDF